MKLTYAKDNEYGIEMSHGRYELFRKILKLIEEQYETIHPDNRSRSKSDIQDLRKKLDYALDHYTDLSSIEEGGIK